ncbi:hypothetical protein [Archangium sp.]|uniref:hypothetical protein n=1 Tax=Archangium sp. TaxID=1872627 RepID=UPI002D60ED3D|nr:hypothetical protein [Archangium sp.]HYO54730.1 hypothetical protein [Archangium sp.]
MSTRPVVGSRPAGARPRHGFGMVAALVLLAGCATGHPRGSPLSGSGIHSRPSSFRSSSGMKQLASSPASTEALGGAGGFSGWPHLSSSQEVLAPFLACTSPAEFIELQRGVDMAWLVERLDDWSAVRLGSLGPLREGTSADVLNRKRASFLVTATREYGAARAELFALFFIHSAFTNDLREVLGLLARDKQLEETLGRMGAVREALRQRGLNLSDYVDRPERLGDVARGLASAANEALSTSELRRGALAMKYSAQRGQLPPPYQRVLDEVERAEMEAAFSPGGVVLGSFDALTLGVPLGFYNLVAGTCHGVYSLSRGRYEQATRELSAAAVLVSLYAGGKGVRYLSEARGATGTRWVRVGQFQVPELGFRGLTEVAERLLNRLGGEGIRELARYMQAHREAALLVYEGGEAGAMALYEARGNVARAQAWLSEARSGRAGPTSTRAGSGKSLGGAASLVDEAAGLPREVVEAKLVQVELDSTGPRLSGDIAVLEKQRPSLAAPPPEAQGNPRWSEYIAYYENRLAELKQGKAVEGPLRWDAYEQMRGLFARGLAFERVMVELLRADAALPRALRRFLGDFSKPRIETYVGVWKPESGLRFADVLIIEEGELSGPLPRVETFSFKSRNLSMLKERALTAQMKADASEALGYYGETLDIRRPSLKHLGPEVPVRRVRLIYEGGELKPKNTKLLEDAVRAVQDKVKGVEVLFQ